MTQKMNLSPQVKRILEKNNQGIKLDIGCGENKQDGFVGMDIRPMKGIDIVQDLETFPWPLPNESVGFAMASHVVEHINPARFGFVNFMNEVWRVMKPKGRFAIACPYGVSSSFVQDPTHVNPCNERTWAYFDPMDLSGLYNVYRPKPWRIIVETLSIHPEGFMEVVLEKRLIDKSYGHVSS